MKVLSCTLAAIVAVACGGASLQAAPIIFDDFNVDEGHFNVAPNFSGTSVGESALSTADHNTTEFVEGTGSQRLEFKHDGSATALRIRHLSGGGTPANNISFTTGPGTDGYIGFYLKVEQMVGTMLVQMALDGPAANGTAPKEIIANGEWNLYEWDLDNPADIAAINGIGGSSPLEDGSHTIDSIVFYAGGTGAEDATKIVAYLDFVAKSDSGSIAALVPGATIPEPSSIALAGLAVVGLGVMARRRAA